MLSAVVCLWTHYFAVFVVVGEAVVLLVVLQRQRRELVASMAGVAVLTAPLWPLLFAQSGVSDKTAYIAVTPVVTRVANAGRQFAMGSNVPTSWLEGAGVLLVVVAVIVAVVRTWYRQSTRILTSVAVIGGGLPILATVLGVADYFVARNILGVWICVVALAAYGLLRLRGVPLVAYSALCVSRIVWGQVSWGYHASPDWKGAGAHLPRRATAAPVAVMPGIEWSVAAYYLHRPQLTTGRSSKDIWVIVQPRRGAHERALTAVRNPPLAQLWGGRFQPVGEVDFHAFRLIHLHSPVPAEVQPTPSHNGPASAPSALLLGLRGG